MSGLSISYEEARGFAARVDAALGRLFLGFAGPRAPGVLPGVPDFELKTANGVGGAPGVDVSSQSYCMQRLTLSYRFLLTGGAHLIETLDDLVEAGVETDSELAKMLQETSYKGVR